MFTRIRRTLRRLPGLAAMAATAFVARGPALAQGTPREANYDESKVPSFTLPDPLVCLDGTKVVDAATWTSRRRPEILRQFTEQVYGRAPERPSSLAFRVLDEDRTALNGKATRKVVSVDFAGSADGPRMELLIYVPNAPGKPAPAFLGLNFGGNQSVANDPKIPPARLWPREIPGQARSPRSAPESSRGSASEAWPVETIIDRGYALATAYSGDVDPGDGDGFRESVHALTLNPGQDQPAADEWGTIAAWAWGLRRAMDYLETDSSIDAKRVAVMGHSRLGKAALWAGAQDERFAMVVSLQSGEGGAALARRRFGETVSLINTVFPRWFCQNFKKYDGREDDLPVDQHELISLIAPRPVLITSASDDAWADPKGEFLSGVEATPVYRLLGRDGLTARSMPTPGTLIGSTVGYSIRAGKHAVLGTDWTCILRFADLRGLHAPAP